jgi:transcriptional regulator with XRE-family HTH domain
MLRKRVATPERLTLRELRTRSGLSQQRLADVMGTSQQGVKKLESAADPRVSTIRRFVAGIGEAVGAPSEVELRATLGKQSFNIQLPASVAAPRSAELTAITAVEGDARAWRMRAWEDPLLEQAMLDRSIIAVSADEVGDLRHRPSRDDLRKLLRAAPAFEDRSEQAIGTFATYWDIFIHRLQPGDLVVVSLTGRRFALADVVGKYDYDGSEPEPRLRHFRPVSWRIRGAPRSMLDEDIRKVANAPGTICALTQPLAVSRLEALAG